jgi:putative DNA primase/helicase
MATTYHCTDLGNAQMFADLFTNQVVYDHQSKCWMHWDGFHWRVDDLEEVYALAAGIAHRRQKAALLISDPDKRKQEMRWGFQSEAANRLEAIVRLARKQPGIANTGKGWDADPLLLGCRNGVLDLKKGKLIKAEPHMGITKQVPIKYDPDAQCPTWIKTLNSYWPGDGEMVDFIHRAVGYSLTGLITEQCLFCLFGSGKNGKSTFLAVLEELMGDYADVMPFSALEFQSRTQISNDVAALRGKRLLISSETQEDVRLNEGRIKALTGDKKMRARFLYTENLSFVQTGKYWLGFNHKPQIRDETDGIWRRIMMILMGQQFGLGSRIKGLEDYLIEKELPGILQWAVEGCLAWLALGLEPTDSIRNETDKYRGEANPVQEFFDERVEKKAGITVTKAEFHLAYLEYCKDTGEKYPLTRKQFARRIGSMGIQECVRGSGNASIKCWAGIVAVNRSPGSFNVTVP